MWHYIGKYPFLTALGVLVFLLGGAYATHKDFFGVFAAPAPRIITPGNTTTEYKPTTTVDGGVCVTFTPALTVMEKRHPLTEESARRLVETELGHPVDKLIQNIFADGCPPLADFRVVFHDPEVDQAFSKLPQPRTAPR